MFKSFFNLFSINEKLQKKKPKDIYSITRCILMTFMLAIVFYSAYELIRNNIDIYLKNNFVYFRIIFHILMVIINFLFLFKFIPEIVINLIYFENKKHIKDDIIDMNSLKKIMFIKFVIVGIFTLILYIAQRYFNDTNFSYKIGIHKYVYNFFNIGGTEIFLSYFKTYKLFILIYFIRDIIFVDLIAMIIGLVLEKYKKKK